MHDQLIILLMNRLLKTRLDLTLACLLIFAVFSILRIRGIGFIDSGELAAACHEMGIAHPTGYPALCQIGAVASRIPIAERLIDRLHLMNAIFSVFSALLFALISLRFLNNQSVIAKPLLESDRIFILMMFLVFAFDEIIRENATELEVHSFQSMLTLLVLYFLTRLMTTTSPQYFMLSFYMMQLVLGLSLANHASSIALIPSIVLFIFLINRKSHYLSMHHVLVSSIFLLLGLSTYLYLPIRSTQTIMIDWGNPETFETFLRHVSGWQFRVWFFNSGDTVLKNILSYLTQLPASTNYLCFLAPFALLQLIKTNKLQAMFCIVLLFSNLFYVSGYDIHDLKPYYFQSEFSVLLLVVLFIGHFSTRLSNLPAWIPSLAVILLVVTNLFFKPSIMSRPHFDLPERYTRLIIDSLPHHALIISRQWDYFCSPFLYLQSVENYRNDVVLIERELLRRSWYYSQLDRHYPGIYQRNKSPFELFLAALKPFERGKIYNANQIQKAFELTIRSLIDTHPDSCFITPEVLDEPDIVRSYSIRPHGFVLQIKGQAEAELNPEDFKVDIPVHFRKDRLVSHFQTLLKDNYRRNIEYWRYVKRDDLAKKWELLLQYD